MWIKDLDPCRYYSKRGDARLKAVGWLSRDKEYSRGPISADVLEKLCQLLEKPWVPFAFAGYHSCELCQFSNIGNRGIGGEGPLRSTSSHELFVPGDGCLFVSPVSIAHYINSHWYAPPQEFCEAVLRCPRMGSVAYHRAVQAVVSKLDNAEMRRVLTVSQIDTIRASDEEAPPEEPCPPRNCPSVPSRTYHTCEHCGYQVTTAGPWEFCRDFMGNRTFTRDIPQSEREHQGISGLSGECYCPTCDRIYDFCLVEDHQPTAAAELWDYYSAMGYDGSPDAWLLCPDCDDYLILGPAASPVLCPHCKAGNLVTTRVDRL